MLTLFLGIVVVGGAILLSIAGFLLVDRFIPHLKRQRHNDVAGFIYAVVGPMFAILMAFVVFVVWQHFEDARGVATAEANELVGLDHLTVTISDRAVAANLHSAAVEYARDVVEDEWPRLNRGDNSPSPKVDQDFAALRKAVYAMPVNNGAQQNFQAVALGEIHQIGSDRRTRLADGQDDLPPILWVVLLVGSVVTIGYSYIFGVENRRSHIVMIAILAGTVAGMLFLIKAIDGAFIGDVAIKPDLFEAFLRSVGGS